MNNVHLEANEFGAGRLTLHGTGSANLVTQATRAHETAHGYDRTGLRAINWVRCATLRINGVPNTASFGAVY